MTRPCGWWRKNDSASTRADGRKFDATIVHAVVFMGLYTVLDRIHFGNPTAGVVAQATANALVGVVAFQVVELLPGAVERRRAAKTRLRR